MGRCITIPLTTNALNKRTYSPRKYLLKLLRCFLNESVHTISQSHFNGGASCCVLVRCSEMKSEYFVNEQEIPAPANRLDSTK